MDSAQTNDVTHRKPLRLWPGVIAVVVQWIFWIGIPIVAPDYAAFGLLSGIAGGLVVLIWWLFLSKAPWPDRIGALLLMVVAVFAARQIVHVSISNGMMGMLLPFLSIPPLSLALVASAAAGRWLASGARRAVMAVAILLACGVPALLRTDGVTGAGVSDFHWRWTPTAEERLLAQARVEPVPPAPPAAPQRAEEPVTMTPGPPVSTRENSASPSDRPVAPKAVHKPSTAATPTSTAANEAAANGSEWPGFRGPKRDGVIRGVRIETDWSRTPPVELWRRAIGPGWSSFAVHRGLIYTQEQRGEHEVVSCYRLSTGELVWQHRDPVRFYESNGGAGPRATPTVSNGHVYTMGATAIVNALDAATGAVAWSRNAQADTGASMPGWGFAGSPLVVGDAVIVAASGRLVAYEAANGKPRWVRQTGGSGYSSPHLATIDGVDQVLLLSGGGGVTSVGPADGTILWQHAWGEGVAIVQPALASNADVLTSAGDMMGGVGMRRLAVKHSPTAWLVEERWTTRGLKPYFNDFVVHKGHAFGFDGTILACIDLEDGQRKWKGGRYGAGQMVLLHEQDLLLVLSEEGELALVSATPETYTEVARFKAIEGKTWNHPVLVRDVLLVRNGEEMAAFRLPRTAPAATHP